MSDSFKNSRQRIGSLVAALSLSALVACSSQDPAQLIASGRDQLDKKNYRAAVIEFKNALQKDASLDEARFLLGRALFESGDSSGALVEFNKLNAAGFDPDRLLPRLAESMLIHGELDKLIAEFAGKKLASAKAQAELSATLASAYGMRGKFDLAHTQKRHQHARFASDVPRLPGQFDAAVPANSRNGSHGYANHSPRASAGLRFNPMKCRRLFGFGPAMPNLLSSPSATASQANSGPGTCQSWSTQYAKSILRGAGTGCCIALRGQSRRPGAACRRWAATL